MYTDVDSSCVQRDGHNSITSRGGSFTVTIITVKTEQLTGSY